MESDSTVDMGTMIEALKIAERLERAAARLKGLGSNTCASERPSLEVLERFQVEQFAQITGLPVKPTPVLLDVAITRDEMGYCHARLMELFNRPAGVGEPAGRDERS